MALMHNLKSGIRKLAPGFVLGGYHLAWAFLAAVRYGFPSKRIKIIGVTGTNGKSTTVKLISAILREAGHKLASSSSIEFEIAGQVKKNTSNNSMPGRFAIQKLLAEAIHQSCNYAVLEVTSEGILQYRHRFINFAAAVITNLTPEHIERHKGFENYRRAKQQLFYATRGVHVINCDDAQAEHFLKLEARQKYCYGLAGGKCWQAGEKINATNVVAGPAGIGFEVGGVEFTSKLTGKFNVYNALAAICVGVSQGVSLEICQRALAKVPVIPGRMEKVSNAPLAFIDYAFTPNALEKVYLAVKQDFLKGKGRLICLLGACGAGRDKWKRPVLGQIAARHCDLIFLADEDPWGEDPRQIIAMVKEGVAGAGFPAENLHEIPDRRQAINAAVALARPEDALVFTGKGSETWIRLGNGKKIPWDEKKAVLEALKQTQKSARAT